MADYLEHHGVPGQRWGVRRYQRSDGSLTRAGKKRFKEVAKSKKLQKAHTKEAIKTLSKEQKRHKVKKDVVLSTKLNTTVKSIKSGDMKAGRDFIVSKRIVTIPYAYIGLTGPKISTVSFGRNQVIIKQH